MAPPRNACGAPPQGRGASGPAKPDPQRPLGFGVAGLLVFVGLGAHAQADGQALFVKHCAACHQADGGGTVGLAPPLKGEHWARLGAERGYLPMVLVHGLSGPIQVNGQAFVGSMPAFGAQLDDETLAAIANHVRQQVQGAADAPLYRADELKAQRDQAGSPPRSRQWRAQLLRP